MATDLTHILRPPKPEELTERNFILKSWIAWMRFSSLSRGVPDRLYNMAQRETCSRILASEAQAMLAVDAEDDDHIYGCVVYGPHLPSASVLHWLYVAEPYRLVGVGRSLFRAMHDPMQTTYCTQPTAIFRQRSLVTRYRMVAFPYLLFGIQPQERPSWPDRPQAPSQPQ